jgi:hypothetical protein
MDTRIVLEKMLWERFHGKCILVYGKMHRKISLEMHLSLYCSNSYSEHISIENTYRRYKEGNYFNDLEWKHPKDASSVSSCNSK